MASFLKSLPSMQKYLIGYPVIIISLTFVLVKITESLLEISEEIHSHNLSYIWPQFVDTLHIIWILPLTILTKILTEKFSFGKVGFLLSSKYKKEESLTVEGKMLSRKIATNIFKTLWNFLMVIFGYCVLNQLKYFPKELLGDGELFRIFEDNYPNLYFHHKPKYFDLLYISNLSYYLIDLIYLLFINEGQSDYNIMIIHHLSSILLIFYSFLSNLSNIGCIVSHIHNIGSIIVYFIRITMYSDICDFYKGFMGVILITVWIYTRIFVFGKLILIMWTDLTNWRWVVWSLWLLLVTLIIMHLYWVIEILKKLIIFIFEKKVEDISKSEFKKD